MGIILRKNINLIYSETDQEVPEVDTAMYINDFFVNIAPNLAKELHLDWYKIRHCRRK